MDYSKYYTPLSIAELLIKQLRIGTPERIVDICCGSCNLLNAAKYRWRNALLFGADIADSKDRNVAFEKTDGRAYALKHKKEFPLVLANPPFGYLERMNEFPQLFQAPFEDYNTSRLENEMLIANLHMLQDGGTLLIIMPSSFVEGASHKALREIIAKCYQVQRIIELDECTFGSSRIHSYALIIRNRVCKKYTCELMLTEKQNNTFAIHLIQKKTSSDLLKGLWTEDSAVHPQMKIDIRRGNVSSACFREKGQAILHTSKLSDAWSPSVRYIDPSISPNTYAEAGDIIVSRIGKSAGQWYVYSGVRIPISDCLYRIKDPNGEIYRRIRDWRFTKKLRGVATRYITMSDFASWIDSLP